MENNMIEMPKFIAKEFRLSRLCSICFNGCITCFLLSMIAMFSSFIIPVFYGLVMMFAVLGLLLLFILVIATFGLILLVPNNPISALMNFIGGSGTDRVMAISQKFFSSLPYLCITGLAFAVVSIIVLSFTKERKVGKIVGLSIVAVILTLFLIFYYVMGGNLWQN